MVITDVIEGTIDGVVWYRYDLTNDVLYMRLAAERETRTVGEETPDGLVLLRREDNDEPVGITIINWWKRFGDGPLPDSIRQIARHIETWKDKIAA